MSFSNHDTIVARGKRADSGIQALPALPAACAVGGIVLPFLVLKQRSGILAMGSNPAAHRAKPRMRHLREESTLTMRTDKLCRFDRRLVRQDSTFIRTELRVADPGPKFFSTALAMLIDNLPLAGRFALRTPRVSTHGNALYLGTALGVCLLPQNPS